jgi:hypothetical protein
MVARKHFGRAGLREVWRGLRVMLFLPFVALCLLPQGVMPVRAADGTIVLSLCAGSGTVDMVIDLATGKEVPRSDHQQDDKPCDWSVSHAQVLEPVIGILSDLALILQTITLPLPQQFHRPAHDPRGLFARGPPQPV